MAPVERTRWMTSTWDCTIDHGCVHWATQPTMDCSGVRVFTVELLCTVFDKLFPSHPPPSPPARQPPYLRWPKIGALFQKRPEMA